MANPSTNSSRFHATPTGLAGLYVLDRQPNSDGRGLFERIFCRRELETWGWPGDVEQINRSISQEIGTVRGLHYQLPPHAEWKAITCTRGLVHDVVVDLRRDSPTFLKHYGVQLGENFARTLLVPGGFAHGFQVINGPAEMLYVHSAAYCKDSERGLRAADPRLQIRWPLPIAAQSPRDASHPLVSDDFLGIKL